MGSAILGIAAVTGESPFTIAKRFWRYGQTITPNAEHANFYNQRYEGYKALRAAYRKGW